MKGTHSAGWRKNQKRSEKKVRDENATEVGMKGTHSAGWRKNQKRSEKKVRDEDAIEAGMKGTHSAGWRSPLHSWCAAAAALPLEQ